MNDHFADDPGFPVHLHGIARREGLDLLCVVLVFQIQGGCEIAAVFDSVSVPDGKAEIAVFQVDVILLHFQGTDVRGIRTGSDAKDEQQGNQDKGQKVIAFHGLIPPF